MSAPWGLLLLTVAALAVVIGGAVVFTRTGKVKVVDTKPAKVTTATPAADVQAPSPTPTAAKVVTILVTSEPSGATVIVAGQLRGETPLRLEGRPGEALPITLRKGSRFWRGTLTLGNELQQAITVKLLVPRVARTPQPQPTAAPRNDQARAFDDAMKDGVRLYEGGWFGPAAGRFRRALAINPSSPRAYLWLGRALIQAGRPAEARQALQKVIELAQTGPQADEAGMLLSRLR